MSGVEEVGLTAEGRDVLEVLNQNANVTAGQLADQLAITVDEAEERLAGLTTGGLVDRYVVIDPRKVGYTVPGYAFAQCEETYREAIEQSLDFVDEHDYVQSIGTVYGEYDLIIKKLSDDPYKLDNFATNAVSYTTAWKTCATTELVRWHGIDVDPEEWETDSDVLWELDATEETVLDALQSDPALRQNLSKLAQHTGLDFEAVDGAITRLEKRNVILGYSVEPNLEKLGWGRAYMVISTLSDLPPSTDVGEENYEQVLDRLTEERRDSEIMKDHLHVPIIGSGRGSENVEIFLELVFESMDHLDKLTDEIREIEGIRTSRTYIEANTYHAEHTVTLD